MRRYPVGIQDFSEIRKGNYVYVDKTTFIEKLFVHGKYYFLSRPRRFGKSLLLSTLDYLFQGRKELFEGLHIENNWDWTKKYPIIKISFSNIGHKELGLQPAINKCLDDIAAKHGIVLKENFNSGKFRSLIENLSAQKGSVAVLIDEYDKPIIDYLNIDINRAIENREILKNFYSVLKDADPYLKMVFITGVSKFSRVSIFSDLNNLSDLSIDPNFSGVCGITQQELDSIFEEELAVFDAEKIKLWYNGYSWNETESVYNPFSILSFFVKRVFQNYWFETGTPTFLINLAKKIHLYAFENSTVSQTQLGSYDIERLQVLPLMFQTGYLTIKSYNHETGIYTLDYPNLEVRLSYLEMLLDSYQQNEFEAGRILAIKLRSILENAELDRLQSLFNNIFKSIPYEIWQRENEHFYHAIIHLTFRLLGIYIESQVQTSDGRMDALVQTARYVYAFEFKLDGSAQDALQQVQKKAYLSPYLHQNKTCIGIGINFSSEAKKVQEIIWATIDA
jgi:Predicted AAA-ATPase/PD-(D/E)XK nuclease superfamily